MKQGLLTFGIAALLSSAPALACDILEKREIQIGVSQGIEGRCSNNNRPIQCISEGPDLLSCRGPEGSFEGYQLQSLIASACGCGAQNNQGASEQLRREFEE